MHSKSSLLIVLLSGLAAIGRADDAVLIGPVKLGGYVEANYQWNFNQPSNGLTNYRGFDNRHNTFTLSNVALDAQWDASNVVGQLMLQVGHTPSTSTWPSPACPARPAPTPPARSTGSTSSRRGSATASRGCAACW